MNREKISEYVKRQLYAESMGRCMNPACKKELFTVHGDIIERAHIDPYSKTADNTYENLVVLCPNCHTDFDKNGAFSSEEVLSWKKTRKKELEVFFKVKYDSFLELKRIAAPILIENKTIYEQYYLKSNRELWDVFEPKIIANNRKLRLLFECNRHLFQTNKNKDSSNLECIDLFLLHIDEFEKTRGSKEKNRQVLFPEIINSIFGIAPVEEGIIQLTESIEALISELIRQKRFVRMNLGVTKPYFVVLEDEKPQCIYLDDAPRVRQMIHDNNCFRKYKIRLESINHAIKFIRSRNVVFTFDCQDNFREIHIGDIKLVFLYEYCLSRAMLQQICPEKNCVLVNLHNWNGSSCISKDAYTTAEKIGVTLLSMDGFYDFVERIAENN